VNVIAVMGGDDVDLRDAELDGSEVTLTVISIMGGASIYVPDTVEVEVSGFSLMGGDSEFGDPRPPRAGAPLVRVRSFNVMGGSTVYRLPRHARGLSLKQARRLAKTAGRLQLPAKD
jgi:Cell wall-active antibiotics response 4TMS YvqF